MLICSTEERPFSRYYNYFLGGGGLLLSHFSEEGRGYLGEKKAPCAYFTILANSVLSAQTVLWICQVLIHPENKLCLKTHTFSWSHKLDRLDNACDVIDPNPRKR